MPERAVAPAERSCSEKDKGAVLRDWQNGWYGRTLACFAGGLLCGFLWEFWNYWAAAKWHYSVPIMENVKIFEMPLPGYLGFPAFALECFTMYVLVRSVLRPAEPAYPVGG